jgi:hypothetical protein
LWYVSRFISTDCGFSFLIPNQIKNLFQIIVLFLL